MSNFYWTLKYLGNIQGLMSNLKHVNFTHQHHHIWQRDPIVSRAFLNPYFFLRYPYIVYLLVTNKDTMHNQGPIDGCTHIDILILPAICSQQVYVLHWIICWYQNLLLLFKNHSLISHTSVRFSKTKFFPWNKKNTDRNDANEQKTHRHTRVSHSVGSGAWGHHHLPLILQFFPKTPGVHFKYICKLAGL